MSFVNVLQKIDRVITARHCIAYIYTHTQLYKTDAHVRTETRVLIALNSSGMTISYWVFVDLPLQAGQRRSAPLNRDGVVGLQQHWPTDQVWQLTEYKKVTCNTSYVVKSHSCPIQVITILDLNQNETSPKGVNSRTIWSVDSARHNHE